MLITYPFTFKTKVFPELNIVYTAERCDELGDVHINWDGKGDDVVTYTSADVYTYLQNGTWTLIKELGPSDIKNALKLKLFAMRIAGLESNLQALKREFEQLKGSI